MRMLQNGSANYTRSDISAIAKAAGFRNKGVEAHRGARFRNTGVGAHRGARRGARRRPPLPFCPLPYSLLFPISAIACAGWGHGPWAIADTACLR
jgi:hypothetical protein